MLLVLLLATAATGQVRALPAPIASSDEARGGVQVYLVNEGPDASSDPPPASIAATAADGTALMLVPDEPGQAVRVASGGFVTVAYRVAPATDPSPPAGPTGEARIAGATGTTTAFLDRFAPHEPIYGAFGLGSDGAKLQYSLAFQPFRGGALDGVRVAWTQTMFWAVDRPSGPFRSTNYSPEAFYLLPVRDDLILSAGYRHDSNGRGAGDGSLDVNRLYLRAAFSADLGGDWQVEAVPQIWAYVGTGYRDLDRYWGNVALGAVVARADGPKLALTVRNPGSRRGAAELFVSHPLYRLGGRNALYLFAQGFAGHGEALDDYFRRTSALRLGIAFTR